ncbi:MAG TPA: ATP-grasp domain-containing protein [Bryobacteraceae bacterium]|nr:ATP-grasp domain-containing protein [Bryobacteraceae bacterium]
MAEDGQKAASEFVEAPPTVLFTSTGPWAFTARLALELSKAGIDVSVLCPANHPLLKTRAVQQVFRYDPFGPLRSLRNAIHATAPQMIIPCDDRAVEHVHELYRTVMREERAGITTLIERSLGPADSYPITSSRRRLLQIAREEGIAVPDTQPIRTLGDCDALNAEKYPWVLKADGTWGGRGVNIAVGRRAARRAFLRLRRIFGLTRVMKRIVFDRDLFWRRSRPAIIAQQYIRGIPANCAAVCWRGQVLAGSAVEVLSAGGNTKPATVVRVIQSPEMITATIKIARRLGLSGFFGLDFMIEKASGIPYLIEMNPRCTPLCHLRLGNGSDLIGALAAELRGQQDAGAPPVTGKDIIAYFPQALQEHRKLLEASYLDIPYEEPELIDELLRESLARKLVARISSSQTLRHAYERMVSTSL